MHCWKPLTALVHLCFGALVWGWFCSGLVLHRENLVLEKFGVAMLDISEDDGLGSLFMLNIRRVNLKP